MQELRDIEDSNRELLREVDELDSNDMRTRHQYPAPALEEDDCSLDGCG